MTDPADFWHELLPKSGEEQSPSRKRHDYCRKVLDLLATSHPNLYSGSPGAALSPEQSQELVDALQKNTPGHIFKQQVSFLIQGLEYGVRILGWEAAIPSQPLVIPRETPRLTLESFAELPRVHRIREAFLKSLKQAVPETRTGRIGQLLLSAVLFGGLVNNRWHSPWIKALKSSVHCDASMMWFEMVLKSDDLELERRRDRKDGVLAATTSRKADHSSSKEPWEFSKRWFADPLTHSLIVRWHRDFPEDRTKENNISAPVALAHYLALIDGDGSDITKSEVRSLIKGSATLLGLVVEPFLLGFAEDVNKSVSLSHDAWYRITTGERLAALEAPTVDGTDEYEKIPSTLLVPTGKGTQADKQEDMLSKVFEIILPESLKKKRTALESRTALLDYYQKESGKMCLTLSCMVLWFVDLLTHYNQEDLTGGRVRSSLKPSSVLTYAQIIGRRLLSTADDVDILKLESDELHDLYQITIESCRSTKRRQKLVQRLHAFHCFLHDKLNANYVDFSDLGFKTGPAELGVNANLISPYEYDRIKSLLCPDFQTASRMRKIQYFCLVIAFRCGLRESEILKLRIKDLLGDTEPELLVRNNRYGYTKTSASIRRIPLYLLLDDQELKLLLAWRRDRLFEDGSIVPQSLLFCMPESPDTMLAENDVIPMIVKAMRQATGDSTLVFHHNRHSFATWLLLRLLPDFPQEVRERVDFLRHSIFDPERCQKLRERLLGENALVRQALYATAVLCGHVSPQVTLLHYFHLCDWLLGVAVKAHDVQPVLDISTIRTITGLQNYVLYYAGNKGSMETSGHISQYLSKLHVPEDFRPKRTASRMRIRPIPDKDGELTPSMIPMWKRVMSVVHERQSSSTPLARLAAKSGFDEDDIKLWCANAEHLAAMKTKKGRPRHVNSATNKKNQHFCFPLLPRLGEDRAMADRVLSAYESSSGKQQQYLLDNVRRFTTSYSVIDGGVSCLKPKMIRDHIRFITSLNVPLSQVLVLKVQHRSARLSLETVRTRLSDSLNIPESSICVRNKYPTESTRTDVCFIQVMNAQSDTRGAFNANYGFRFAMYAIAIMEGLF